MPTREQLRLHALRHVVALATAVMLPVIASAQIARPDATFSTGAPMTTNNDDSCDIALMPAATLLLPFFEVDVNAPDATSDTTFSIVNVSHLPQIANVVIWTDRGYPLLSFQQFLTGYDAQTTSLYDVLVRGILPNTSSATTPGGRSAANTANPNLHPAARFACAERPSTIEPSLAAQVRAALTSGTGPGGTVVGNTHANAIGYVTIDVVATCGSGNAPTDTAYYSTLLLFDNVLTGEYMIENGSVMTGSIFGNSMVHIRAVPEGGQAGSLPGTNLPYTFYDRFSRDYIPRSDRRQPLPSVSMTRWISGGGSGFNTEVVMWREPVGGEGHSSNASMTVAEIVRFDESENAFAFAAGGASSPVTSRVMSNSSFFPPIYSGQVGGWFYCNLNNGGSSNYTAARAGFAPSGSGTVTRPSQNWVMYRLILEGRSSNEAHSTAFGNGCTPATAAPATIGPAANATP